MPKNLTDRLKENQNSQNSNFRYSIKDLLGAITLGAAGISALKFGDQFIDNYILTQEKIPPTPLEYATTFFVFSAIGLIYAIGDNYFKEQE